MSEAKDARNTLKKASSTGTGSGARGGSSAGGVPAQTSDTTSVSRPPLRRLRDESDARYAERAALFEKYRDQYGDERAEVLCTQWSNMKHLECRYPPEVERILASWGGKFGLPWLVSLVQMCVSVLAANRLSCTS